MYSTVHHQGAGLVLERRRSLERSLLEHGEQSVSAVGQQLRRLAHQQRQYVHDDRKQLRVTSGRVQVMLQRLRGEPGVLRILERISVGKVGFEAACGLQCGCLAER